MNTNIAQSLSQIISDVEFDNNVEILVNGKWFRLCTEQQFSDWVCQNVDLKPYMGKPYKDEDYQTTRDYEVSEVMEDNRNTKMVQKYIKSNNIILSQLKALV